MPQADNAVFQSYLDHVQSQIKWKRARKPLLKELSDHILDQKREYEAEGQAPDEALSRAVSEMGDPVSVGRELDRLHKPENHWVPAIVFLLTAFVGSLIIGPGVGSGYAIYRQLFAVLCSTILLPAVWFSDYTVLYRRTGWCFLAGGGGVVLSYLFLRMGADPLVTLAGWRRIFIYLALLMPVLYTAVLCRFRPKGTVGALGFGTLALVFSLTAMGNMAAVVVSALAMLLTLSVAILRGRFRVGRLRGLLCAWAPAAVAAALYLATHFEQFTRRFMVLFAPERDPLNYGFAAIQLRKLLFSLPFVNTSGVMPSIESGQEILLTPDYYLVRLSAGCGWFVLPLAFLLSAVLFWALFRRIRRLQSENGRLLALTAGWVLLLETAGYLLVNTFGGFLLGPISMPFLSYGPTAQLVNFLLLGLLLSIFRMDALVRDPARPLGEGRSGLSIYLPFHKGRIQITYEA